MKKVFFVADFFIHEVVGGAEKNDDALIEEITRQGFDVTRINCRDLTPELIQANSSSVFILANFVQLSFECMLELMKDSNYIIYEHDYKLFKNRNPINYPQFQAPSNHLMNVNFYKKAHRVVFLSQLQEDIYQRNLSLTNAENIHCSIFNNGTLNFIKSLNGAPKKHNKFAIVDSSNPIKKRDASITYCKSEGLEFDLIKSPDYFTFLELLSSYEKLLILTGHPEPTPRIAVEAKMLNTQVRCQKNLIGVASEPWYSLNGDALVDKMKSLRKDAGSSFKKWIEEYTHNDT